MEANIDNELFDLDVTDNGGYWDCEENLNDPELDKYIVLFFREECNDNSWCGTGVIFANYLITVAHVMLDKDTRNELPYLYFKYEGQINRVDTHDIIYDGRDGLNLDTDNIHHDLIVFKLTKIKSPFTLNTKSFDIPLSVYAWTYRGDAHSSFGTTYQILLDKGVKYEPERKNNEPYFEWKNCILVSGDFMKGNSGTPIYRKNVIYGLLIGATEHKDYPKNIFNFIDARYIQEIILKTA